MAKAGHIRRFGKIPALNRNMRRLVYSRLNNKSEQHFSSPLAEGEENIFGQTPEAELLAL